MRRAAFLYLTGVLLSLPLSATAITLYVDLNCTNSAPPYTNWLTAATNIQNAVDAANAGDEVVVTNGVYQTGGQTLGLSITQRVAVTLAITVRSVNGPAATVIQGYQLPDKTNGVGAVRCVYLAAGAVLEGFTVTNGATADPGNTYYEQSGGGVWCASSTSIVTNCLITGNAARSYGGGAFSGSLNNCTLTGNSASEGGGAHSGVLNNCALSGNSASEGGGARWGTLTKCTLTNNLAYVGGGAADGTLSNCTLTGNSAARDGGGRIMPG